MSDAVTIALIAAAAVVLIFVISIVVFRDRITGIKANVREGSLELVLTPEDKAAALRNLVQAEKRKKGKTKAPVREVSAEMADVEQSISDLSNKIQKSVLWVDDNPDQNVYEVQALQSLGMRVVQVVSNKDAYAALQRDKFDLVITDIGRGPLKENGLDLVDSLAKSNPTLPAIVYTSPEGAQNRKAEAERRGAKGITALPVELTSLVIKYLR